MNGKTMFKNTADQAMASWVTYLNQLRIDALFEKLTIQDMNLSEMLKILDCLKLDIAELVESNRGGEKGIHGFIGERLQVGLSNAKNIIDGIKPTYKLIDDNGRDDFLNGSIPIQLKCVQKNCGLDAIKKHLETYPNFLKNGGKYQIPKDYYNRLNTLWSLPEEDVGRLGRADLRLYRNIQKFFNETGLHKSDIEPMEVDYSEVQKGTYNQTINNKERDYRSKDAENRNKAYEKSKPSMKEAGVITGVSAGIEGGIEFCLAILKK